jgi:hypothetical protein
MKKIFIFTDIDGVLQINNPKKWNKKCCRLYNDICKEFNLLPVITSTWRVHYKNINDLQLIFNNQGIDVNLYSYTDVLGIDRGEEIQIFLDNNQCDNFVIIDDNVRDIIKYFPNNTVKIDKSYIGLTEENINEIRKILK